MSAAARSPSRKVLVLGKDTRAFLSVVRSLGRRGIEVHVGWCEAGAAAAHSRYVGTIHEIPPPTLKDFRWRDRLLEILDRENFDLVIPCNDPSILPLQLHRKDFAPFLDSLYLLDEHAFRIAFDKLESYELARTLGIPVPRRLRASRLEDLASALSSFSLPVLVKPKASFTVDRLERKHHVRWARSPQELESLVQALLPWGDVAIEERVSGRGAGVEVLAHQGQLLVAFQHVRLHEPPSGGGSSYRRSTALHPELLAATQKFLQALRYTGVAMMEFKIDSDRGTWAFIEINARFWGSLPLALAAGVDFPSHLYEMWVEGRRDFAQGYRTGVSCRNLANDFLWMKRNVPRWRMPAELVRLLPLREHSDTFVLDDPWPGVAEVWSGVRHVARAVGRTLTELALAWTPRRRHRTTSIRQALQRASRVLFVCKGNVCRSAFAHRLAERVLPSSLHVASCGYHPEAGRPCPADAVRVAAEMGIDLRPHRSTVLSPGMLRDADIVFVFDHDNYSTLRDRYPWAMSRVHFLGLLGDPPTAIIRDPYGGSPDDFRVVYEAIRRSVMSAVSNPGPRARSFRSLLGALGRLRRRECPTLPYMPVADIRALEGLLLELPDDRPLRIFEYGSGGSSIHFPRFLRERRRSFVWFALEHDPEWAQEVGRGLAKHALHDVHLLLTTVPQVAPARLNRTKHRRSMVQAGRRFDYGAYTDTPGRIHPDYDLILIDGRDRKRCLETAIPLLRPGGFVAFHDAQRSYYRCALARHPEGTFRTPKLWVWRRSPEPCNP